MGGYPAAGFSSITAVRRVTACSAGNRPGGQEGPYTCSFVRSRSFVRRCEVVDAFYWGTGDDIEYRASMLDRTGALDRRTAQQSSYCREPTVVVFKISPSENFSPPPSTPTTTTGPVRTLCDVSTLALDLNFEDQVRSRHHVQVQSPISTAQYTIVER